LHIEALWRELEEAADEQAMSARIAESRKL